MLASRVLRRSLASASKRFDYVVVGGGPVGCSIAYHLAKSGAKNIAVLEQDSSYRTASAMLSAGGIRQQFSVPENVKMQIYGAQFLKNNADLSVDGEVPDLQFHENGYLFLSEESTKDVLLGNYKVQKENGAEWITLLQKADLEAKFPWLNTEDLAMGTFGTMNEGYFDPWLFVSAIRKKAQSLGVQFLERKVFGGQLALSSAASTSSYQVEYLRTVNPKTPSVEEKITGGNYINAAGAWSGRLVSALASSLTNTSSIHTVPVNPRKRCIFSIHCSALEGVPPSNSPLVVDNSGVYFRPEINRKGHFILGVSPPEDNDPDISEKDEKAALQYVDHQIFEDTIWPALATRVPAFAKIKVTSSWAGFYDYNSLDQVCHLFIICFSLKLTRCFVL